MSQKLHTRYMYRHSYNGILIGTYTCPTQVCHFRRPWVTLSDSQIFSDTKHRAVSLRQLSFLLQIIRRARKLHNSSSFFLHLCKSMFILIFYLNDCLFRFSILPAAFCICITNTKYSFVLCICYIFKNCILCFALYLKYIYKDFFCIQIHFNVF